MPDQTLKEFTFMATTESTLAQLCEKHDAMKPIPYLEAYETLFTERRNEPLRVLELGVHKGGSINAWSDYFPNAVIVGVDINKKPESFPLLERVHFIQGRQEDPAVLASAVAFGPFDLIIDDAAHLGRLAKASFNQLYDEHLKTSGAYVLEDWAAALVMPKWPDAIPRKDIGDTDVDFPSYDGGMVGFLKQLIDHVVSPRPDIRAKRIAKIHVQPGLAFLRKC